MISATFSLVFSGFWLGWGAVLVISAVSATFFGDFSGCFAGFRELFCRFQQFQLLFSGIFPAVSLWLGSCFVDFSSFSYLFSRIFPAFGLDWGGCFRSFMDYSYPRPVCYQPMAIVHCANLVWGILC